MPPPRNPHEPREPREPRDISPYTGLPMLSIMQIQRLSARPRTAEAAADWAEIEADSQARAERMMARMAERMIVR